MNKRAVIISVAVLAVVGIMVCQTFFIYQLCQELKSIRSDVSTIETDVSGIEHDVHEINSELYDVSSHTSDIDDNVENIKSRLMFR